VNYSINWNLLGAPVDVGGAVQRGFEAGATRSALSSLVANPTDEGALSQLAMFQPQAAIQMRDRARDEQYRTRIRSAFDPATGQIDPAAMRGALAERGDIGDIVAYERGQASSAEAQQETADARRQRLAQLAEQANAGNWPQVRAAALEIDPALAESIPPDFDPDWVSRQRLILGALGDPEQRTSLMREFEAAGGALDTPEGQAQFRRLLENRYAAPPRIVTGPNGELMVVGGGAQAGGQSPPSPGTIEDGYRFRGGDPADSENWVPVEGGAGRSDPQTFPQ